MKLKIITLIIISMVYVYNYILMFYNRFGNFMDGFPANREYLVALNIEILIIYLLLRKLKTLAAPPMVAWIIHGSCLMALPYNHFAFVGAVIMGAAIVAIHRESSG